MRAEEWVKIMPAALGLQVLFSL